MTTATTELTTKTVTSVCSLPSDELEDRIGMIRAEILPHVRRSETLRNGVALDFDASPERRAQLERFVAFERECCSDLDWVLEQRDDTTIRLVVEGLGPDSDVAALFSERGGSTKSRGSLARFAKAGAFGFGAAFFVCCVLPIGLAALAGAAIAAPFAALDNPFALAGASLVTGTAAWWWLKRRSVARECC